MHEPFLAEAWPCAVFFQDAYQKHCAQGYSRMTGHRAVVCGLARDVGLVLPAMIDTLERAGTLFADYRIVLYENDSVDDTLLQLQAWSKRNGKVCVISETLGRPKWGPVQEVQRTRDLAYYRNQYHTHISRYFSDFDFVLVVDTDLLGWSMEGLANTFGQSGWDAVGSNGLGWWHSRPVYMDAWALRAVGHPDAHVGRTVCLSPIPCGLPLLPVLSCFGGLAVYTMAAFRAGCYDGADCEHVTFHRSLQAQGYHRLFLNPSMLTLYPPFESIYPKAVLPEPYLRFKQLI